MVKLAQGVVDVHYGCQLLKLLGKILQVSLSEGVVIEKKFFGLWHSAFSHKSCHVRKGMEQQLNGVLVEIAECTLEELSLAEVSGFNNKTVPVITLQGDWQRLDCQVPCEHSCLRLAFEDSVCGLENHVSRNSELLTEAHKGLDCIALDGRVDCFFAVLSLQSVKYPLA